MTITIRPGIKLSPGTSVKVPVAPPVPKSLSWDGTDNIFVHVTDNTSDWNLSNPPSGPGYWTIEWWEKRPTGAREFFNAVMCSAYPDGIDVYHQDGWVFLWNGAYQFQEPAKNVWNHIAVSNTSTGITAYVNGQPVTVLGSSYGIYKMANGIANLIIGCRSPDGEATPFTQYFVGQLANIKISNVARYSGAFTPSTALESDANTVLAVSGELVDLTGRHTITNNGVAVSTDFPS